MSNQPINKIVINENDDSINSNMSAAPTVENMYDLYHHTHRIEDIIGGGDSGPIPEEVSQKIDNNEKAIKEITEKIDSGDIITGLTFEEL